LLTPRIPSRLYPESRVSKDASFDFPFKITGLTLDRYDGDSFNMSKLVASELSTICIAMAQRPWDERNEVEPNPDITGPGVSGNPVERLFDSSI
jgi:hypothetical protein